MEVSFRRMRKPAAMIIAGPNALPVCRPGARSAPGSAAAACCAAGAPPGPSKRSRKVQRQRRFFVAKRGAPPGGFPLSRSGCERIAQRSVASDLPSRREAAARDDQNVLAAARPSPRLTPHLIAMTLWWARRSTTAPPLRELRVRAHASPRPRVFARRDADESRALAESGVRLAPSAQRKPWRTEFQSASVCSCSEVRDGGNEGPWWPQHGAMISPLSAD